MALWMEWHLLDDEDEAAVVSGGPVDHVKVGRQINWDVHSKQGVHFFQQWKDQQIKSVQCEVIFKPEEGDFEFTFDRICS
jgi:hypothetical protein